MANRDSGTWVVTDESCRECVLRFYLEVLRYYRFRKAAGYLEPFYADLNLEITALFNGENPYPLDIRHMEWRTGGDARLCCRDFRLRQEPDRRVVKEVRSRLPGPYPRGRQRYPRRRRGPVGPVER